MVVIGAGLSGALMATVLGQRGFSVILLEKRPDLRTTDISAGRSINLALSNRGIRALDKIGITDAVLQTTIPVYGRMVHDDRGNTDLQLYSGRKNLCNYSVKRGDLNALLLDAAERTGRVDILFQATCTYVDLQRAVVYYTKDGQERQIEAEVVIGADGAGSALRRSMLQHSSTLRFNYMQKFIDHGYKELRIPPSGDGSHRIYANALHIWPKGEYMLIALPNADGSFTVTLFLPMEGGEVSFATLQTPEAVRRFFEREFADVVMHIEDLEGDFFRNPTGTMSTIKCYPWQTYGRTLLIGDAAHAVVPFYGQGMNAAFEDVRILDDMMGEDFDGDWRKLFTEFERLRKPDADAIADMAEENYYEMRKYVKDTTFIIKRKLELALEQTFDDFHSKYSLVTYCDEVPYRVAQRLGHCQDDYLMEFSSNLRLETVEHIDLATLLKQIRKACGTPKGTCLSSVKRE